MLNQNILIASGDYIKAGTCLTPTLFLSGYGAEFYKNKKLWQFSRFAGSSTYVVEDLGGTRNMRLFGVIKHNMGSVATWRVRAAHTEEDLLTTPVYDSGWIDIAPYDSGFGTDDWGVFDWGTQSSFDNTEGLNRCAYHAPDDDVVARYVRYDFDDSDSVDSREDNYVQFARLWASSGYQPSLNMLYGAEIFQDDSTDEVESRNKVRHYAPLVVKQRRLVAGFNDLPKRELLRDIFGALFMQVGKSEEIIALLAPMEPEHYAYEAIYGNLAQTDSAKYSFYNRMTSTLSIKESL